MPEIMIKCPETGKPVSTGIAMDKASFESTDMSDNTLGKCPACGKDHVWSKEDAFLKGE